MMQKVQNLFLRRGLLENIIAPLNKFTCNFQLFLKTITPEILIYFDCYDCPVLASAFTHGRE